ncbi:MAG TPA: hypothetical protein VHR84_09385 [Terriglobales bacterium]|jgi:hypothetical protein|nr:hypothetical protein [Terriglobales bacterium]
MRFRARFALWITVLLCSIRTPIQAQVVLAVFNDAEVSPTVLDEASKTSIEIYRRAGIELDWVNCPRGTNLELCLQPPDGSNRFSMRIVPDSLRLKSEVFGIAFLGKDGRGSQGDIFFKPVQALSASEPCSLGALLGSVAAHELGHLLLGTNAHATDGLMRSRWEVPQLAHVKAGTLSFLDDQAKRLRERTSKSIVSARMETRIGVPE